MGLVTTVEEDNISTLSFIPSLSTTVYYIQREEKHLFLNYEVPDWIVVNKNSAFIISLIDGKKSIQDILNIINSYSGNYSKHTLFELVNKLKKHKIINYFQEKIVQNNIPNKHVKLHSVHIQLTNECNLSCKYCFAESGQNLSKTNLTINELKKIIDDINQFSNNVTYILSGGEPLLFPEHMELMEYIYQKGNKIHLLTNGIFINKDNVKEITKLTSLIKISLDGSTNEINSNTRGKNSFYSIMDGYELLSKNNANVQISMTVTKKNIHDIPNMVNLFGNKLTLQPLFKAGRASKNKDLEISGIEYFEALANIEGLQPMGRVGQTLQRIKGKGVQKCAMADSEISISEDGNVYPCQMLTDDEFCGGNIKEMNIHEILNSKTFNEISTFSSLTNEGCKDCPIKLICGGSCRARAYYETGDINVNSEFCDYEKLAYIEGIFENYEFNN